ncbi:MAG TPA: substrate-binding domain-containing protein [Chloroflexota bacterium]|jgi:tungstate transport system substrate-binding protein
MIRSRLLGMIVAVLLLAACGPAAAPISRDGSAAGAARAPAGGAAASAPSGPATAAQPVAQPTPAAKPDNPEVILATTTSTQDSGLLDVLIPMFEQGSGYQVKPIAVGTGQALALGARGEADVVLVHAPEAEQEWMAGGNGTERLLVMHNDFIVIGPADDPAGVRGTTTAEAGFARIAQARAPFISRGDDSGTNKQEQAIWQAAGLDPKGQAWYQETGQGMGATLNVSNEKRAYTLTDRGTYLARKGTLQLDIVSEGSKTLLNVYHVMPVNPAKFPKVNVAGGKAFADFMVAPATQEVIGGYGADQYGQPLFFPDAGKREDDVGA